MDKINKSKNLGELQNILSQLKPGFGLEFDPKYEQTK